MSCTSFRLMLILFFFFGLETRCDRMEGLRLFPPVPMTFRQAAKTDYIDGVLVPKGTLLYIPVRFPFPFPHHFPYFIRIFLI